MAKFKFIIIRYKFLVIPFIMTLVLASCKTTKDLKIEVYETSAQGNSLKRITEFSSSEKPVVISINPEEKFQTITGFGGAFTESSAHLLYKLSAARSEEHTSELQSQ